MSACEMPWMVHDGSETLLSRIGLIEGEGNGFPSRVICLIHTLAASKLDLRDTQASSGRWYRTYHITEAKRIGFRSADPATSDMYGCAILLLLFHFDHLQLILLPA